MTDTPSPFDDPEFAELLKSAGVVHRPGMVDELMAEIGPLLAADGIDLENLDQNIDLDELNAAMGRAMARHNMELVTPVGQARALTLNLLREFVLAQHAGNTKLADSMLDQLRPDPTKHHPSFSHLMGITTETLDAWHTDPQLQPALTREAQGNASSRANAVVIELDALAKKGRAFRSIESLLRQHNGAMVAAGGAHAVANAVVAIANHRQHPLQRVLDELLPGEKVNGGMGSGAAFGGIAAHQASSQDGIKDFEQWLIVNEEITLSDPEDIEIFEMLAEAAWAIGLDVFEAEDFGQIADIALQLTEPEAVEWTLDVLHDYVHYRMEGDDAKSWDAPHYIITGMGEDGVGLPPQLQAVLDSKDDIPVQDRYAAVVATPLITGIPKLVEWLGNSQPVTATAMPRRADIATVAAMIGIDAQGVAKTVPTEVNDVVIQAWDLSKPAPKQPTIQVQSAHQISELRSWWVTLEMHDGIELLATRVRPGLAAQELAEQQIDDLDALETFITSYVREYLTDAAQHIFGDVSVMQTAKEILALAGAYEPPPELDAEDGEDLGLTIALQHLRSLEAVGLLEIRNAQPFIPEPLRPVVVLGVMLALVDLETAR